MNNNSLLPSPTPTDVSNDPDVPVWFKDAKAHEALGSKKRPRHVKLQSLALAIIAILLLGVGIYYGVINTL